MKRNENLVPLSRDHHFGLLCVWKIRQGLNKGISYERIKKYINYFWETHLCKHFEIEDNVLPPMEIESLQTQMDKEHSEIKRLVKTINQSDNKQLLSDFADALYKHIRFEERVVFAHFEENISDEMMEKIGAEILQIHQKEEDNYPDEFWK